MDFDVTDIAKLFGLDPATVAAVIPLVIIIANRIARAIPDSATGWKKYVRLVCKFIGLHIKDNTGVPAILDTAGSVIRREVPTKIPEVIGETLIPDEHPNLFAQAASKLKDSE